MSESRLTPKQRETLIDVERGGEIGAVYAEHYPPIKNLVSQGLIALRQSKFVSAYYYEGRMYVITEAGRALLRSIEGGERG